ncbi:MAG: SGNH/GDSL hydrolase family protein [Verrucomicrobiota bacterium]
MQITKRRRFIGCATTTWLALAILLATVSNSLADIAVKEGQKIGFMGDSITAGGWSNPGGYVRLVIAGLEANGIKATPAPAGVSGNKSNQMLERLKRDVLDKKPDWMTLSCGVNDVWHGVKGVPLDQYKTNITTIIEQCQAANVKVVILTATVIGEEVDNDNNKKLASYNEFLRELAKAKKCPLADLNALFQEAIKAHPNSTGKPGRLLTSDGVHMNSAGDQLMAQGVLQAMGCDAAQIQKAQAAWLDMPGGGTVKARFDAGKGQRLEVAYPLTLRQREKLQTAVAKESKSLNDLLTAALVADVKSLLKPAGEYESAAAIFLAKKEKDVQKLLQEKFNQHVESLLKN